MSAKLVLFFWTGFLLVGNIMLHVIVTIRTTLIMSGNYPSSLTLRCLGCTRMPISPRITKKHYRYHPHLCHTPCTCVHRHTVLVTLYINFGVVIWWDIIDTASSIWRWWKILTRCSGWISKWHPLQTATRLWHWKGEIYKSPSHRL